MRLLDDDGSELEADFDLEPTLSGADVVLHSSGGSKNGPSRNPDYFSALELLLERMSRATPVIDKITVESTEALKMPPERRVVHVGCPITLAPSLDLRALRIQITEAQTSAASSMPTGRPGGNKTKRIRLSFSFDTEVHDVTELLDVVSDPGDTKSRTSSPFGRPYTDDPVDRKIASTGVFSRDDSKVERALAGHAETQNALAAHLRDHDLEPRKRGVGEPDFDIAWSDDVGIVVAEVKSLHAANVVHQLRVGIGQVLQYRETLRRLRGAPVKAVLAVEFDPGEPWHDVCNRADIVLTWPPSWRGALNGKPDS